MFQDESTIITVVYIYRMFQDESTIITVVYIYSMFQDESTIITVVYIYRMFQDESTIIQENVSWTKFHRCSRKYIYPEVGIYENSDEVSFKECKLLCVVLITSS